LSGNGEFIESLNFDTHQSYEESDSLANYLKQLLIDQIVIFSARDEASSHLTEEAKAIITNIGSKVIFNLEYRDSWGMIAIVGRGVVCECLKKKGDGPSTSDISNIHANFKLDADGEYIGIFHKNGIVIDSVFYSLQISNISYGRIPDTSDNWSFLSEQTAGSTNNNCQTRYDKLNPPSFSSVEGIYSEPLYLTISSTHQSCKIYYTLDGSQPNDSSYLYDDKPIIIDRTTIIRACCKKENYFDSDIITRSYIIQPSSLLKVISLITDPDNLWDQEYGIYTIGKDSLCPNYLGRGKKWERNATFSLFNYEGKKIINTDCGIRIHGGFSRTIPKKSFRIYFPELINFYPPLFNNNDLLKHDVLVLSGGANDCVADYREWFKKKWSLLRNSLMIQLYKTLDYSVVNNCFVNLYLNGDYWGIYIISERINEQFLLNHFSISNADLIKDNSSAESGSMKYWEETINFFRTTDLTIKNNYKNALQLIDLQNLTDYFVLNLLGANIDWPEGNVYCFRDIESDTKWKWFMWDSDCSFLTEPSYNNLNEVITTENKNEIFFNLIRSDIYREYFGNRTCYLLNHLLTPNRICSIIDSLSSFLEEEIENETNRWGGSKTQWLENIDNMKNFAIRRPTNFREIIKKELDFGTEVYINILNDNISQGIVKINDNEIKSFPFHGIYFSKLPIQLQVLPNEGYIFKSWGNNRLQNELTINTYISDTLNLYLEFEKIETFKTKKGNFEIYPNYPNPFNSKTNLKLFSLEDTEIKIDIYNIKGQSILTMKKIVKSGYNTIAWDAKNKAGYNVPSGIYVYTISDSKSYRTKKMLLIR